MAERKKQPSTSEEVIEDIKNHSERGKLNGEEVVALDRREVRGTCGAEAKRKLLRVAACYGYDMSEVLGAAISALWSKERENVEAHEREKTEKFGVTSTEIHSKTYGAYKARGRAKKANFKYPEGKE